MEKGVHDRALAKSGYLTKQPASHAAVSRRKTRRVERGSLVESSGHWPTSRHYEYQDAPASILLRSLARALARRDPRAVARARREHDGHYSYPDLSAGRAAHGPSRRSAWPRLRIGPIGNAIRSGPVWVALGLLPKLARPFALSAVSRHRSQHALRPQFPTDAATAPTAAASPAAAEASHQLLGRSERNAGSAGQRDRISPLPRQRRPRWFG
jgi:hypothetical protein